MKFYSFGGVAALAAIVLVTVPFSSAQKDDAYVDRARGQDVTQSVVRRILRSNIFPDDHSFLLRIAKTESDFGIDDHTFRANYTGGIWQLNHDYFNMTKANTTLLRPYHAAISAYFNINWLDVSWSQLLKPMYSGLGARLFLAQIPGNNVAFPETISLQAFQWSQYYHIGGDREKFISDARELQNSTRCRGKMDLCIVLDGSNSITSSQFLQAKNFTASLIESFELDFTRLGMLVYSTGVEITFPVNNTHTIANMSALANAARHPQGNTATGLGMLEGIKLLVDSDPIEGIPQVMAVLTDGQSNRPPSIDDAVKEALNKSVSTFAVGIGSGIGYAELLKIAMNDTGRVFSLANFDSLADFLFRLTSVTCELPQRPIINETYEDNLMKNEKRFYELIVPLGGITIRINVTVGRTGGFWSYSEEVPSAAVNDGALRTDGATFIPYRAVSSRTGARQEEGSGVFISVEGLDDENVYSFSTLPGNHEKKTGGSSGLHISSVLFVVVVAVQSLFR